MDYEGICEDLLEMERKAGFYAVRSMDTERPSRIYELLSFARQCQTFRHDLFLSGYGGGGY